MKIRSKHSDKIQKVSFIQWYYNTPHKEEYIVIEWGDLVYWQLIDIEGTKNDHRIIARDHAVRIIDSDDKRNTIREITDLEWMDLKSQFYDTPNHESTRQEEIDLRSIEWELLIYISQTEEHNKRSTKAFADSTGYSVTTMNDVAKTLKRKYLIETELESGVDSKTQKLYTSFRCKLTPLGKETLVFSEQKLSGKIKDVQYKQEPNLQEILELSKNFESYSFGKKKEIIHMIENSLRSNEFDIESSRLREFKYNKNILPRIIYYLSQEYNSEINIDDDIRNMIIEYEKITSSSTKRSLIALHYSIRMIKNNLKLNSDLIFDSEAFQRVLHFLEANQSLDKGDQIKHNLRFIIDDKQLRKIPITEAGSLLFTTARKLIAKDELLKSIRYLFDQYDTKSIELNQLSSRLNSITRKNIRGVLTQGEYERERNKISLSLLQLIEIFENE